MIENIPYLNVGLLETLFKIVHAVKQIIELLIAVEQRAYIEKLY